MSLPGETREIRARPLVESNQRCLVVENSLNRASHCALKLSRRNSSASLAILRRPPNQLAQNGRRATNPKITPAAAARHRCFVRRILVGVGGSNSGHLAAADHKGSAFHLLRVLEGGSEFPPRRGLVVKRL